MRDVLAGLSALLARTKDVIERAIVARPEWIPAGTKLLAAFDQAPWSPARISTRPSWPSTGCGMSTARTTWGGLTRIWLRTLRPDPNTRNLDLIKLLWRNVNAVPGWNVAIGGSDAAGRPAYNALTELCLEAARGSRRPNLALRVRRDMPDAVWERAIDAIASGCGLPALYNEEGYLSALPEAFPGIGGDAALYAFGGCTETMVHGCSNVGSIDGGLNLLAVLSQDGPRSAGCGAPFRRILRLGAGRHSRDDPRSDRLRQRRSALEGGTAAPAAAQPADRRLPGARRSTSTPAARATTAA